MPPPNVESCLIGFKPKQPHELLTLHGGATHKQFFTFVQACFAQKRKMLRNNLKAVVREETTMDGAFAMLDRGEKIRPQELTMEEYVRLFNFIRESEPS
jgi:16S rRNA A1518/A1519 N6-dimethyltransferase RsmA/KsgA/DIM1 with predicted DNA glycosylase/AP lyase activity